MISTNVLTYFQRHKDKDVFLDQMALDLGCTEEQVRDCINNCRRRNSANILDYLEVVVRGNQWIWHTRKGLGTPYSKSVLGVTNAGRRLFEELTTTRAGIIIVQDEEGNLYKLSEIE